MHCDDDADNKEMINSMDILEAMAARLPEGRAAYLGRLPESPIRPCHLIMGDGQEIQIQRDAVEITAQYRVLSYAETTDSAGNCDYASLCALAGETLGIAAGGRLVVDGRYLHVKGAKQTMVNDAVETVFTLQYGDIIAEQTQMDAKIIEEVEMNYG